MSVTPPAAANPSAKRTYTHFHWEQLKLLPLAKSLSRLGMSVVDLALEKGNELKLELWDPFHQPVAMEDCFPGIRAKSGRLRKTEDRPSLSLRAMDRLRFFFLAGRIRHQKEKSALAIWSPLVRQLSKRTLSSQGLQRLVALLLGRRFFGASPFVFPPFLWKAVGQLAFNSPKFQRELAQKVLGYLHSRVLLDHPNLAPLHFASETLWFLISLQEPQQPKRLKRLLPSFRRRRALALKLQHVAVLQAYTSGWAGFWDQWLLLHWFAHHPDSVKRLDPALLQALGQLPLFQVTRADWPKFPLSDDSFQDGGSIHFADPTSSVYDPSWLFQLYESTLWEVPHRV